MGISKAMRVFESPYYVFSNLSVRSIYSEVLAIVYVPIGSDAPELERKGVQKGLKDSVIIPKVKLSTLDMS